VISGHTFQDFDGDPSLTGRPIEMIALDCEPWGRRSHGDGSGGPFFITPVDEGGKAGCRLGVDRIGIERGIGEGGDRDRKGHASADSEWLGRERQRCGRDANGPGEIDHLVRRKGDLSRDPIIPRSYEGLSARRSRNGANLKNARGEC
jgi:hypothetical protein